MNPRAYNVGNSNVMSDDGRQKDFFAYNLTVSSIAAAAVASSTILIEADSMFVAQKLTVFATIAGAAVTESTEVLPLVTLQITDQGSGRNLFNQPTAIPTICGSGQRPFILPIPRAFKSNSALLLTFSNYSAATTYRLDVTLSGLKVFN